MSKKHSNKVIKYIIFIPVVSIMLLSALFMYVIVHNQNLHLQDDINNQKDLIKNNVNLSISLDMDKEISQRIQYIKNKYKEQNRLMIFLASIITLLAVSASVLLARNIAKRLNQANEIIYKKDLKFTAIGQLAAGITHEINTPLTFIKGNFEMIKYDIMDLPDNQIKERMLEDSQKVMDGINRLSNIVESMREMSQKSKEVKEDENIYHTLITSLTLLYNRSKQISNIKLNGELFTIGFDKHKEIFICSVQKRRVEQTWIVIINNALDELIKVDNFDDRLIEINIQCSDNHKDIVIKIKDNAGGIPKNIINNIFEPFVSSKESSGMGVGLNVAKKIIEDQSGTIQAYNDDTGAVFEIRIECRSCSIKC